MGDEISSDESLDDDELGFVEATRFYTNPSGFS